MPSTQTFMDIPIGLDPDTAWSIRWIFVADMNRDGHITISDFWLWVQWVFYAPGDCILFGVMLQLPSVARFLEITTAMLFGGWSFVLSLLVWYFVVVGAFSAAYDALTGTH